MADKKAPIFLARKSYQRRRLRDASRVLPIAGGIAFMIPLMWHGDDVIERGTSDAMMFVFGVWIVLVILAALLVRPTREEDEGPTGGEKEQDVL